MAGKGRRDYAILIRTDDPSMFDRLPAADSGWEGTMSSSDGVWRKTGEPTRHGSAADPENQGGHVLAEGDPWGESVAAQQEQDKRQSSPRIEPF